MAHIQDMETPPLIFGATSLRKSHYGTNMISKVKNPPRLGYENNGLPKANGSVIIFRERELIFTFMGNKRADLREFNKIEKLNGFKLRFEVLSFDHGREEAVVYVEEHDDSMPRDIWVMKRLHRTICDWITNSLEGSKQTFLNLVYERMQNGFFEPDNTFSAPSQAQSVIPLRQPSSVQCRIRGRHSVSQETSSPPPSIQNQISDRHAQRSNSPSPPSERYSVSERQSVINYNKEPSVACIMKVGSLLEKQRLGHELTKEDLMALVELAINPELEVATADARPEISRYERDSVENWSGHHGEFSPNQLKRSTYQDKRSRSPEQYQHNEEPQNYRTRNDENTKRRWEPREEGDYYDSRGSRVTIRRQSDY